MPSPIFAISLAYRGCTTENFIGFISCKKTVRAHANTGNADFSA